VNSSLEILKRNKEGRAKTMVKKGHGHHHHNKPQQPQGGGETGESEGEALLIPEEGGAEGGGGGGSGKATETRAPQQIFSEPSDIENGPSGLESSLSPDEREER
jgi:hypothetical protein